MNFLNSHREPNSSISFRIDRNTLEEKCTKSSDIHWVRVAPHKIVLVAPDNAWLLEDQTHCHSGEYRVHRSGYKVDSQTVGNY